VDIGEAIAEAFMINTGLVENRSMDAMDVDLFEKIQADIQSKLIPMIQSDVALLRLFVATGITIGS
jgi:hypothetical protein|tara:strand:- start:2194 stop:2391 length:198 start_codon:yes stop_codon:yes gene_type:complete